MSHLPVCSKAFDLGIPDGSSEMYILEAGGGEAAVAVTLLAGLTSLDNLPATDRAIAALCITDFEYLMLSLRQVWHMPPPVLGLTCGHCREPSEFSPDIAALLRGAVPKAVQGVKPHPELAGWFVLDGGAFRLPTAGDQIAVAGHSRPTQALADSCLDKAARERGLRPRIERAMERMAPEISTTIRGHCPACDMPLEAYFPVVRTVLAELRHGAGGLHDDIDLIARAYHWSQAEILAMPQDRRKAYVSRIHHAFDRAA
jgi:hypothetical protein